jgi:hypothetical protein
MARELNESKGEEDKHLRFHWSSYATKIQRRGQTHRTNIQRKLGQTPTMQGAAADKFD